MNRSRSAAVQSSPVQQMGTCWTINNIRPPPLQPAPPHHLLPSSIIAPSPWNDGNHFPHSWSQLLLGGNEDKNLEEAAVNQNPNSSSCWSQFHQMASPNSCITTLTNNNNMLDFSPKSSDFKDPSSQCDLRATGGAVKKARIEQTAVGHSSFKVRKEKLGDRITALHQLVSPFGKTDTASVLLEAIGYIRFLQSQIEALSTPYMATQHQEEESEAKKKDLRRRGLCLVPISCTVGVGNDVINGADYWASAFGSNLQ